MTKYVVVELQICWGQATPVDDLHHEGCYYVHNILYFPGELYETFEAACVAAIARCREAIVRAEAEVARLRGTLAELETATR